MTDRRAELLTAIRATDDDHAKLVYADWLEEQGDVARANLIRRQCELAAIPVWERTAIEARWEVEHLLAEHGAAWRAELPAFEDIEWLDFERGFPASVRAATPAALYASAEALAEVAPVHTATITTLDESDMPVPMGGVPWLRTLRLERYQGIELHPHRTLVDQVDAIELDNVWHDWATRVIQGRKPALPLRRLAVGGEHPVGGLVVTQLFELTGARALRELRLGTSFVDHDTGYYEDPTLRAAGAATLAAMELAELEVLDLRRQRVTGPALGALLATTPHVRELVVAGCELADLDALAGDGAPLEVLDASENAIGERGSRVLGTVPRLAEVKSLALATCELGASTVAALVRSPAWQTLRIVDLSKNPLGGGGAHCLATAPRPSHLHTLKLADCDLDAGAAVALQACPWLDQLIELDLARNTVTADLLRGLASVRVLDLEGCTITGARDGMLDAIWARAVRLDLSGLDLEGLVPNDGAPTLQHLALRGARVTPALFDRLVELPRLHELDLARAVLEPSWVAERLGRRGAGHLRTIDLRRLAFAPADLVTLARAPELRHVTLKLDGTPWQFPPQIRDELAARWGRDWYHHDEDEDVDEDADEDDA